MKPTSPTMTITKGESLSDSYNAKIQRSANTLSESAYALYKRAQSIHIALLGYEYGAASDSTAKEIPPSGLLASVYTNNSDTWLQLDRTQDILNAIINELE